MPLTCDIVAKFCAVVLGAKSNNGDDDDNMTETGRFGNLK